MDSETFIWEDEGFEIDFDGQGYRFEPEYSEEEFLRRKAEYEQQLSEESTVAPAAEAAAPRVTGTWWCSCRKCRQMPTEEESLCCAEWDLLITEGMENLNVSGDVSPQSVSPTCVTDRDVRDLLRRPVIETFFHVPKPNWRRRSRPEGLNGQLSDR